MLFAIAGGIESVTLGDEEARRRGVQKSILERAGPPTFDVAVSSSSLLFRSPVVLSQPQCEVRQQPKASTCLSLDSTCSLQQEFEMVNRMRWPVHRNEDVPSNKVP